MPNRDNISIKVSSCFFFITSDCLMKAHSRIRWVMLSSSFVICHPVLMEETEFKMLQYGRSLSCFSWSDMYCLINVASVASAFINSYLHKLRHTCLIELCTQNFPQFFARFRRLISKLTKHYLLSQKWFHCIFPMSKRKGVFPPGKCWVLISDQACLSWYLWVYPNTYRDYNQSQERKTSCGNGV